MTNFGLYHITHTVPYMPEPAPGPKWKRVDRAFAVSLSGGYGFYHRDKKLGIISSKDTMENGKVYLHISLSHKDHIPNWETMKLVKDVFIGKDRDAIIYLPPEREYVNLMPYCLHLWSEVEA